MAFFILLYIYTVQGKALGESLSHAYVMPQPFFRMAPLLPKVIPKSSEKGAKNMVPVTRPTSTRIQQNCMAQHLEKEDMC